MSRLTGWSLARPQTVNLLSNWSVGKLLFLRPGPGTASPAVIVTTARGQCLLKQRNPRYCASGWLAWDHAVLRHLSRGGLPVHPALRSRSGDRWVREEGQVYELYPWVEGEAYDPDCPEQIAAAGELLARLHECTADLRPAGRKPIRRLFDPRDRLPEIGEAKELVQQGADTGGLSQAEAETTLDYLETQVQGLLRRLPLERLAALPQAIVHGDYHPANMTFRGDRIEGLFDFDWTCRQARMKDVADGLLFFAPRERPWGSDLASLTQPPRFDPATMRRFLDAYRQRLPLTVEEGECLADLLRERWLYVRLDAMHRKVPAEGKLAFLLPGVVEPLRWLDRHGGELAAALAS